MDKMEDTMKWKLIASAIYQMLRRIDREDRERIADYILDIVEVKYADNAALMFACEQLRHMLNIPEFDDEG